MHIDSDHINIEKMVFAYIITHNNLKTVDEFINKYHETVNNIDYEILKENNITFNPKSDINGSYVSRRFQLFDIYKKDKYYTILTEDLKFLKFELKKALFNLESLHFNIIPQPFIGIDTNIYEADDEREGIYMLVLNVEEATEKPIANIIYKTLLAQKLNAFTSIIPGVCSVTILTKYKFNVVTLSEIFNELTGNKETPFESENYYENFDDSNSFSNYPPEIKWITLAALGDEEALFKYKINHIDEEDITEAAKEIDELIERIKNGEDFLHR